MYESKDDPMISRRAFAIRLSKHAAVTLGVLGLWLLVGIAGYGVLGHLNLVDAFLNAAMIAGGMGPVDILTNDSAKVFAGIYAIVSGVVLIGAAGIVLAPVVHRVLHGLHIDDTDDGSGDDDEQGAKPAKKPAK